MIIALRALLPTVVYRRARFAFSSVYSRGGDSGALAGQGYFPAIGLAALVTAALGALARARFARAASSARAMTHGDMIDRLATYGDPLAIERLMLISSLTDPA